ncbi:uncharacterized protein isoform X2 [Danio rerio]|uniref:Uncharacterized protein isoform X2 n=1 Tax=Danio rerio TaxID=7955 RepID=A0AC58J0X1_DANRE
MMMSSTAPSLDLWSVRPSPLKTGFTVLGSSAPLVAPLGSSVVLPCFASELLPAEGLRVEWRRTDSNNLVHLIIDGKSRAEEQHQDYYQRAHFITEEIQHGVYSLRLDDLRADDKGLYRCKVYSQRDAGATLVEIKAVEYLSVSGSAGPVSVSVGGHVTLSCSVKSHVPPEEIERVSWRKADEDLQLLHFEKSAVIPADERYRERVVFFPSEIPKGNFSVRLRSVRTEDAGVYMCLVKTGGVSANTTVIIETHSLSEFHTLILFLCVAASGSALLLYFLIYCRSQSNCTAKCLQMCLIFLPNIMMFTAVILWGLSEGLEHETVACSALFLLRPNMLFRAGPYGSQVISQWMNYGFWSFLEYIVITGVIYQVLFFKYALDQSWQSTVFIVVSVGLSFALLLLVFLLWCMMDCDNAWRNNDPQSQILHAVLEGMLAILGMLIMGGLHLDKQVLLAVGVFPLLSSWMGLAYPGITVLLPRRSNSLLVRKGQWLSGIILINAFMLCFYIYTLENHQDYMAWASVVVFLQIQWTLMDLTWAFNKSVGRHSRFVYLFGSVGVVLLTSSTLTLNILNGERVLGDLRIVLFASESVFASALLVLQIAAPGEACEFRGCHMPSKIILGTVIVGSKILSLLKLCNVINFN